MVCGSKTEIKGEVNIMARAVTDMWPTYTRIRGQIDNYTQEHGYPPTVRELCSLVGVASTSTVHRYLTKMASFGIISYEPTKPRTLTIC